MTAVLRFWLVAAGLSTITCGSPDAGPSLRAETGTQTSGDATTISVVAQGDAATISVAAVGDIMLGSTYPDASGGSLSRTTLLGEVAPTLAAADVAFGNLEGPLFDGAGEPSCSTGGIAERNHGRPGTTCWAFRMPVRSGVWLRDAGFDVVSLANNHVDDFGSAGRASTIAELDRLGIAYSGPNGTIARLVVRGRAVHVIAFATYLGLNDLRDLAAARRLVRASVDAGAIVVVSFHGGAEGAAARHVGNAGETFWGEDRGAVRPFAHAMIDAGAALVIGHGPHVLRALEIYRGRLIAYSLGTFASYRGISVDGILGTTMILGVTLASDGAFAGGRIHSVVQTGAGGPKLDPGRAAVMAVRELSMADIGAAAPLIADDGTLSVR